MICISIHFGIKPKKGGSPPSDSMFIDVIMVIVLFFIGMNICARCIEFFCKNIVLTVIERIEYTII